LITARKITPWVLALGLVLALCVLVFGKPAGAEEPRPDVEPVIVAGNPTCADRGYEHEFKVDPPNAGTYNLPGGGTVTVATTDGVYFDWTSTLVGMDAVIVKGGPQANAYVYDPPAESFGDDGLHSPNNPSGGPAALSHISFCWDGETVVPKPLTATKTATGNYDRTITWDLTKTVEPASHSGVAGDSFESEWTVNATKEVVEDKFKVTGDIIINNPNGFPVDFSATDKLSDDTVADVVDCDPNAGGNQDSGTVLANGSATCSYSASPTNKNAQKNTAHVTSHTAGVGGADPEAAITWNANVIGDEEVKLDDPRLNISKTISGDTTEKIKEPFTCPTEKAAYTTNPLVTSYKNVATLNGPPGGTNLSADATVTVTCRYPWVDETATGIGQKYMGTSNWFMVTDFNALPPVNLIAGQNYDAGDITFTRGGNPSKTTITITLHNGFRFANVANNLKIHPFPVAQPQYKPPGQFKYKFNCSQALNTCTATGLDNAPYYGIHVDVERFVN
jgi:hypothetical protein